VSGHEKIERWRQCRFLAGEKLPTAGRAIALHCDTAGSLRRSTDIELDRKLSLKRMEPAVQVTEVRLSLDEYDDVKTLSEIAGA